MSKHLSDLVQTIPLWTAYSPIAARFARMAQDQAELCGKLMRMSGATREEVREHVSHSVYSLQDLVAYYQAFARWPCCGVRGGSGRGNLCKS